MFVYKFADKSAAPQGEGICWTDSNGVTWWPMEVVTQDAVWSDGVEPVLVTPRQTAPGYWIACSTEDHAPPLPDPVATLPGRPEPWLSGAELPPIAG